MDATTHPSTDASTAAGDVERFDRTERLVHWATAALVLVCIATAIALSFGPVAVIVGRRDLVRQVHVIAGLLLPLPLIAGVVGPWSRSLRADLGRLDRFDALDRSRLRLFGRDPFAESGKFHAGQKLNAAFLAGGLVLLFATGIVLRWFGPFPLSIRRGATFVHDWAAFLLTIDVIAHVLLALGDREALRAMVRGRTSLEWARRVHPRWRP